MAWKWLKLLIVISPVLLYKLSLSSIMEMHLVAKVSCVQNNYEEQKILYLHNNAILRTEN